MNLFHGGAPGRRVGDVLLPNMAEHRYVDGCPHCEAQRNGSWTPGMDPGTPEGWLYATSDRPYARYYASRAVLGTLYRVRLEGDVERSFEDPFHSWRGRNAVVVGVLERSVALSMLERRKLFKRWGGSDEEFEEMILAALRAAAP